MADGKFVRQLPALELASGNFFRSVESLIVSHVSDESSMFVPASVNQDSDVDDFINSVFAGSDTVREAVLQRYPPSTSPGVGYTDAKGRLGALIRDGTFTCNVRYIAMAYACPNCRKPSSSVYGLQYSRAPGTHGSDIMPTFFNPTGTLAMLLGSDPVLAAFATSYQSYLTSHARTGNPNTHRLSNSTIEWPKISAGPTLGNVLDAGDAGFRLVTDEQTTAEICDFWLDMQAAMTSLGGYAPPGAVVKSSMTQNVSVAAASANFKTRRQGGSTRKIPKPKLKKPGFFHLKSLYT